MKILLTCILLLSLRLTSTAQLLNHVSIPDVQFATGADGGTILNNGDFIIHGLESTAANYIYRMNNSGDTIFSKLHEKGTGETTIYGIQHSIVETDDGGFFYIKTFIFLISVI